ncbi:MAG TPA: hypothetical protein VK452_07060 [Dissulfurispiraceae bacterium]|nr:hypothetical protein [Dissulfurispiraceae bacterium]
MVSYKIMDKSKYLLALGTAAAAGAAAGVFANRRNPGLGGLFGAVAGLTVAAAASVAHKYLQVCNDDGIDYYSETSPFYQDFDDIEME